MTKILVHENPNQFQISKNAAFYHKFIHGGLSSILGKRVLAFILNIYCAFHKTLLVEYIGNHFSNEEILIGSVLYAQSIFNKKIYYITFIAVDDNYRRKKIGSILISEGSKIITNSHTKTISIKVKTINEESNKAIKFYKKNGFKKYLSHGKFLYMLKTI